MAREIAAALADKAGQREASNSGYITVGQDYVTWLFGHMYEQAAPEDYDPANKRWDIDLLPFVPETWRLKPIEKSRPHLNIVRGLIKKASQIVNAGDAEREGQLLVDEVLLEAGVDPFAPNVFRLWISSFARKDVLEGIAKVFPNRDKRNLYNAAICRQRADWIHGINLTRFYTIKVRDSGGRQVISIGRVQTPTLKLVVDRDREIEKFRAVDHYLPSGIFRHENGTFRASWIIPSDYDGVDSEGRLVDRAVAERVLAAVSGKTGRIQSYARDTKSKSPPLPFSLSALQTACSAKFGMTAQGTLEIAQALYEKYKVTTYPRSDSRYLPLSILKDEAPVILKAMAGYAPVAEVAKNADARLRSPAWNDSKVSDHHAIIPTVEANAARLAALPPRERQVFDLIANSFLAQFYPDYRYEAQSTVVLVEEFRFKANGKRVLDDGWKRVFQTEEKDDSEDEDGDALPVMKMGDPAIVEKGEVQSKRTTPPKRFTDGTLLEAMVNVHRYVSDPQMKQRLKDVKGIGQEATRANIIETILRRDFLKRDKKFIISTEIGRSVIDVIPEDLPDPAITAMWEHAMERVFKGDLTVEAFLEKQAASIRKRITDGRSQEIAVKGVVAEPLPGDGETCKCCGKGVMKTKLVRDGKLAGRRYLMCSAWTNKDLDGCRNVIRPLSEFGRRYEPLPGDGERCPKCSKGFLRTVTITKGEHIGKRFIACDYQVQGDARSCDYRVWPDAGPKKTMEGDGQPCTKCGKGVMKTREIRTGASAGKLFLSCSEYRKDDPNACTNVVWPQEERKKLAGDGDPCPQCGKGHMRTITLKAGKNAGKSFLSCSNYRKDDPDSCSHSIWPDAKAGGGSKSSKAETQKSSGRRPGFAPKPRVFK